MKRTLLIVAVVLVVLGLVLTAAALFATDFTFDFFQFETTERTLELTEDFQNIAIEVDTADVYFLPALDGKGKVYLTETKKQFHDVFVANDTLTVRAVDTRHWYEQLFSFGTMSVEIYLPQSRYVNLFCETDTGDLQMPSAFLFSIAEIETDTGDVDWHANTTGRLSLSTDTGKMQLLGLQAGSLKLEAGTGDIQIVDTTALQRIEVETDTGDVTFDKADGESIYVETDTGDVTGTFLTEKLFRGESDTGRVDVPWDTRGGDCIVITDTGDIKLSVAK